MSSLSQTLDIYHSPANNKNGRNSCGTMSSQETHLTEQEPLGMSWKYEREPSPKVRRRPKSELLEPVMSKEPELSTAAIPAPIVCAEPMHRTPFDPSMSRSVEDLRQLNSRHALDLISEVSAQEDEHCAPLNASIDMAASLQQDNENLRRQIHCLTALTTRQKAELASRESNERRLRHQLRMAQQKIELYSRDLHRSDDTSDRIASFSQEDNTLHSDSGICSSKSRPSLCQCRSKASQIDVDLALPPVNFPLFIGDFVIEEDSSKPRLFAALKQAIDDLRRWESYARRLVRNLVEQGQFRLESSVHREWHEQSFNTPAEQKWFSYAMLLTEKLLCLSADELQQVNNHILQRDNTMNSVLSLGRTSSLP